MAEPNVIRAARHGPVVVAAALLGAAALGCGGGGSGKLRCDRDPELLQDQRGRDCGRTEDCPCGARCELGACTFDCLGDGDCEGGMACDALGRCVPRDQLGAPSRVSGGGRGVLVVSRTLVELLTPESVQSFRVRARARDLERVRIDPEDGIEVACGTEAEFAAQCTIAPLVKGAAATAVRARHVGDAPADQDLRYEIDVRAAGHREVVGVRVASRPTEATDRAGTYEGTAHLVGAGLQSRTTDDALPDELERLELPVQAHVFPESGGQVPVRLFDDRGAVFAPDSAGRLSLNAERQWNLEVARRDYLRGDGDDPLRLDIAVRGSMQGATFREGVLQGNYTATFEGMTPADQAPFARWRLTMVRTGDLPSDAEPPGFEPDPAPDVRPRANAPVPEESTGRTALDVSGVTGPDEKAVATLCSQQGQTLVTSFSSDTYGYGDLRCADGGGSPQRAFGVQDGTLLDRGAFVTQCTDGLAGTETPSLGDASAEDVCVDRVRAITAAGHALETDRRRAFGEGLSADLQASRIGLRILQQWMGTQEFTAAEPRRIYRLAPLLPGGSDASMLRNYANRGEVERTLQTSIEAWNLLLHPRFAAPLAAMSPQALHSPDYRSAVGEYPDGEPALGLPVTMLYALTAHLQGARGLVDDLVNLRADASESDDLTHQLSEFLPRGVVVFTLAQGLYDAARSTGTPSWNGAWESSRVAYGSALTDMLRSLRFLESGANPLGIQDGDLPLYRLGDEEGTIERFTALSDQLLGREDTTAPAIAPTLVSQASQAAGGARDAIAMILERDLQAELGEAATDRRLEDIRRRFGEQVASLCGDPSFDSAEVLGMADAIDPERCFLKSGCGFSLEDIQARLSPADAGYQVCVAAKMRQRFGEGVSTGQQELDDQLDSVVGAFGANSSFFSSSGVRQAIDGFAAAYEGVSTEARVDLPDSVSQQDIREIESECESARQTTLDGRPMETPDSCTATEECPAGMYCESGSGTCVPENETPDPSCFWGSMGEVALAIRGAATDVEIARSELEEYSERYDNAMRGCILLQQGNRATEEAISQHNSTMNSLGQAKLAADIAANVASAAKDSFGASSPFEAVGTLVAGGAEAAAQSTSDTIATRMDMVERAHGLTLEKIENRSEFQQCLNEAEAELVGTRSAALRIRRQQEELAQLLVELENMKNSVGALLAEGNAALANERARAVSPPHIDYWVDGAVDTFETRMRRARRAMYLAVLGVEYEFQFSSPERTAVLSAQTPAELEAVLGRLRDRTRRGAPEGGGNPNQLLTVLSVRDNLMQLADRSGFDPAWHHLPEDERFGRILSSQRYAVYDEQGQYLGQEIPFTIQPFGPMQLADSGAIPLLSGLNCSERLWHVNATVQGENLMEGTDTTLVSMQLRKRNTFSSQWCAEGREDPPLQVASTRPSRNLFVDPFSALSWNDDATLAELTDTGAQSSFAGATIQARTNIERRQFETESYEDGRSQALAGRGVFGDYTLFLPATSLAVDGGSGLQLASVKDILIRLDYVAAEAR